MIIINKPVKNSNLFGDILFDNHFPINTPTRLELIKAIELPIKTIIGFPDSAAVSYTHLTLPTILRV